MPFTFNFNPSGITNPFSFQQAPPSPGAMAGSSAQRQSRPLRPLPGHSHAVSDGQSTYLSPQSFPDAHHHHLDNRLSAPPLKRRPEQTSSASTSTHSLVLEPGARKNLKRGWVPAHVEPSRAATLQAHTSGYLDTPAKYRDLAAMSDQDDETVEDMVADLPPAKRRRGITGSIISTAFSAALIGTAVGLTVYRLWRDRGKEPERNREHEHVQEQQQQLPPPPPYQQGDWVDVKAAQSQQPTTPVTTVTPPTPNKPRRPRQSPATVGRRAGARRKAGPSTGARYNTNPQRGMSPAVIAADPRFDFAESSRMEDEVGVEDQMDWMSDKLAQLIQDGKRALGREVVVASETAEDEVDDGRGDWEELEPEHRQAQASTSSTTHGSTRRRGSRSRSRPAPLTSASSFTSNSPYSSSHPASARSSSFHINEFGQVTSTAVTTPRSAAWDVPSSASRQLSPGLAVNFKEDDAMLGVSPTIRESMESARAAYLAKRNANASQSSSSTYGLGL